VQSDARLFALGFLGGLVCDFLPVYKLRMTRREAWPAYLGSTAYWTVTVVSSALAGGVAVLALSGASGEVALAALVRQSLGRGMTTLPRLREQLPKSWQARLRAAAGKASS
jgi:hypothetical protein